MWNIACPFNTASMQYGLFLIVSSFVFLSFPGLAERQIAKLETQSNISWNHIKTLAEDLEM